MADQTYALYTYGLEGGAEVCHDYTTKSDGSPLDQATAQAAGEKLQQEFQNDPNHSFSEFSFMVLPQEALPA